jgi:hypothetical protein
LPSDSGGAVDPTSESALLGGLLTTEDIPSDVTVTNAPEVAESDTIGFTDNKGIRFARQLLNGTSAVTAIYDLRWQFPTKSTARAFLKAANDLSELKSSGLTARTDAPGFGDESLVYSGTVDGKTVFNYLIRVRNVLAKVYLEGTSDLTADAADEIANAAAIRTDQALEDPFPTADEQAILDHVPPDIVDSCKRTYEFYFAEIDSVHCRPSDHPQTDYSLFPAQKQADAAFDADLKANGNPAKTGSCSTGKYTNDYTIGGVHAGRLMCVPSGKNKIIEWTDEQLAILTYTTSTTLSWDDLHDYWLNDAGPNR